MYEEAKAVLQESGLVIFKVGPPVATAGLILFGVPLAQWVAIVSGVYTLLMIGGFIYDRFIKKKCKCVHCGHENN